MADKGLFAKDTLLAAGLILLLTLAIYSNSFQAGFHYDDVHQIVMNENIRELGNIPRFFTDASLSSHYKDVKIYRPVTYSSFAVNYAVSGGRVWSWHLFNIVLQFLNALLVFAIVKAVTDNGERGGNSVTPLIAALVFAAHPIQTGAVTYISGRSALLASFFCLSAFYAFARHRSGGGYAWAVLAPVFFLLGLLSKEMAVCFIGIALAYDFIFTVPIKGGYKGAARAALYYIPLIATLLLYLVLKKTIQGALGDPNRTGTAAGYLLSEARVFPMYLRLLLLPMNQNADYNLPAAGTAGLPAVISVILIIALLLLIYRMRSTNKAAAFFGIWFLAALAPESSVVPISDIAVEYRLYLPSIGLVAMFALLARDLVKRTAAGRALALAVLSMLAVLTFNRNLVWADDRTLWGDVAKKAPYSSRAHANYGCALAYDKMYADALRELNLAVEIEPDNPQGGKAHNEIGLCYAKAGLTDKAVSEFMKALDSSPNNMDPYINMGEAYYSAGRYDEALDVYKTAEKLDPGNGRVYYNRALAYSRMGRRGDAVKEMERALSIMPDDFDTRYNMAVMYMDIRMTEEAKDQAKAALALASDASQRKDSETLAAELGVR